MVFPGIFYVPMPLKIFSSILIFNWFVEVNTDNDFIVTEREEKKLKFEIVFL